jgi:hypothetical protein
MRNFVHLSVLDQTDEVRSEFHVEVMLDRDDSPKFAEVGIAHNHWVPDSMETLSMLSQLKHSYGLKCMIF